MSIYRYPDGSWVKEVAFRYGGDASLAALLSPAADATPDQLSVVRAALDLEGWQSIPVTLNGKDMLQVSGFAQAKDMHLFLSDHEFIAGLPQLVPEDDTAKNTSAEKPKSFFQRNSLQLGGILNLVGDVFFLRSGIKTHDPSKIVGGALYTLGGTNLAAFGKTRPDQALRELTTDTADLLKDALGGKLPENSSLAKAELQKAPSVFTNSLYDNAAQNTMGIYTAGAGAMLASGIKKYQDGKGWGGLGYGISSLVVKIGSFMIPEKSKDDKSRSKKHHGAMGRMVEWMHEKPLRMWYGSVVTDLFLAADSYMDHKRDPKSKNYVWSATTAATYIMADLLIAISNKDPHNAEGKLNADAQRGIEAMAAEAIASQPEAVRSDLILQVSAFLADQLNTTGSVDDFKKSLTEQVTGLGKNRWVERVTQGSESPQPSL